MGLWLLFRMTLVVRVGKTGGRVRTAALLHGVPLWTPLSGGPSRRPLHEAVNHSGRWCGAHMCPPKSWLHQPARTGLIMRWQGRRGHRERQCGRRESAATFRLPPRPAAAPPPGERTWVARPVHRGRAGKDAPRCTQRQRRPPKGRATQVCQGRRSGRPAVGGGRDDAARSTGIILVDDRWRIGRGNGADGGERLSVNASDAPPAGASDTAYVAVLAETGRGPQCVQEG